ncbi:MFS transporter [Opitutus sp. ER46]|uniref:MFS transporter n=1 Tax=Opitutus sp. ER46 TaxID=2161864 RepID=UPI000D31BD42|nr:MFS transporter [Opitutus sp. ER46]PTX91374.1 MFS transporter [Opitutus sp. ER46]
MTSPAPKFPFKWELLLLLSLAFFFHQGDRAIFGVVVSQVRVDLGLSDSQIGLVGSVLFLALALLMPFAGYAGDKWPKHRVITACLIFWSAATLFTGLATGLFSLIMLRSIATAGGESFYSPAAYALLARHHRETRSIAMSVHQAALYTGVMTSGFLGGWIAQHWGWRSAFFAFGSGGILLGFVFILRLRAARVGPEESRVAGETAATSPLQDLGRALGVLFRVPTAVMLTIAFTAIVFVNNAYVVWAPEFLREKGGLSLTLAAGYAMFFHHLAALVGVLVGGWLSDRWAQRRPTARLELQITAMALGAPALLWMGLAPSVVSVCAAMALFGLCRGFYECNTHASLFDVIVPRYRASAVAVMVMAAFLVGSLSPWLLGRFREIYPAGHGLGYGFAWFGAFYALGAIAVVVARLKFFAKDRITEAP